MPWQDNPKLPKKSTTTERDDDGGGDEGLLYWCLFCVLATELSFFYILKCICSSLPTDEGGTSISFLVQLRKLAAQYKSPCSRSQKPNLLKVTEATLAQVSEKPNREFPVGCLTRRPGWLPSHLPYVSERGFFRGRNSMVLFGKNEMDWNKGQHCFMREQWILYSIALLIPVSLESSVRP